MLYSGHIGYTNSSTKTVAVTLNQPKTGLVFLLSSECMTVIAPPAVTAVTQEQDSGALNWAKGALEKLCQRWAMINMDCITGDMWTFSRRQLLWLPNAALEMWANLNSKCPYLSLCGWVEVEVWAEVGAAAWRSDVKWRRTTTRSDT